MYSMPPYPHLATDYSTQLSLFTHHMWIGGFLIVGVTAHATIFMIQNTHALAPGATAPGATASTSLTWRGGELVAVGGKVALLPIPLGTADFLSDVWGSVSDQGVVTHITGENFAQSSITVNGWISYGHRYPRFSQGLAQDPTTRRIWFGIATAHDFESHDDITEERLYQNIFASHFRHLVHVVIPASRGECVRWNNFLDVLPHPQGLGSLFTGLALASLGVITSLVDQHIYSLPAYAFIAQDFTTQAALYTHHQCIAGFIMTGAFAHRAIFFIRDYNPEQNEDNVLAKMLDHKEAIISYLSWASLFLGFHTLGLYVHNDVMLAFGTLEKQILIEPIFAQWIQSAHGKTSYGFDVLLSSTSGPAFNAGQSIWLSGWLNVVNENSNSLFLTIGPGDFLVHHAIALGLHTTTLILVKCALDAHGSKLMPDKKDFVIVFRAMAQDEVGNVSQFNESSTYLMGWLRDYLWLNSSQLINGYNLFGMNSLSVWAWMFLFGHLVWATRFMFLISWRGYWQELIETLAWAHERTPLANLIRWRDKPVALSIVQARLVGLAHFFEFNHYGKEKFDSEGEEEAKIGTEISFDSSILKKEISKVPALSDKWEIYGKLQSLPRNSAPTRLHRCCFFTGRPRANYRAFGLSGHILREMVHACLFPGATRSSWYKWAILFVQMGWRGAFYPCLSISFKFLSSARGRAVW
ncbi:Photosystem I chlorophyll a apoprotein A2 [Capsicum annuum]|nr:Photosystem I chlorophyll a apoprotein A2 [Capsicum annuum]